MAGLEEYVQSAIVFCSRWSFGSIILDDIRPKFHQFMLNLIQGQNVSENFKLTK